MFTSREPLPDPFSGNVVEVRRLDQRDAIHLVGRVLGEANLMPNAADAGESESEIEKLVDAVDCHARSLVLLAGEVAASGVRHAAENIGELMASVEAKNPGNPERSLLASVELSLAPFIRGNKTEDPPTWACFRVVQAHSQWAWCCDWSQSSVLYSCASLGLWDLSISSTSAM